MHFRRQLHDSTTSLAVPAHSLTVAHGALSRCAERSHFLTKLAKPADVLRPRSYSATVSSAIVVTALTAIRRFQKKWQRRAIHNSVSSRALPQTNREPPNSLENTGRHWETFVSRIGPPITERDDMSLTSRWRWGDGRLRTVTYSADFITTMAWHEETLCFGTARGIVRSIDVQSGAIVGDYCIGSHVPPSCVSALHFDGGLVVSGDVNGRINVWRAELPGSWGFTHSPDWVLSSESGSSAHEDRITAIVVLSEAVVSSSIDGFIVFWETFSSREVLPARSIELTAEHTPILSMTSDADVVFAGLADGSVWRLPRGADPELLFELSGLFEDSPQVSDSQEGVEGFWDLPDVHPKGVTSLAFDDTTQTLLLGCQDGSILKWDMETEAPVPFAKFHAAAVRTLSVKLQEDDTSLLISSASDGRVGVWDMSTGKPLWGLSGLHPDSLVACADRTRLITNGLRVNQSYKGDTGVLYENWKDPAPSASKYPRCEAMLCFDMITDADKS